MKYDPYSRYVFLIKENMAKINEYVEKMESYYRQCQKALSNYPYPKPYPENKPDHDGEYIVWAKLDGQVEKYIGFWGGGDWSGFLWEEEIIYFLEIPEVEE